jgi:tRNA (adenine22-N1)-methyltransferase
MTPKISKRLSFILNLIPETADVFYDLCCDHAQLGIAVAHKYSYQTINLVDQVRVIMDKVSKVLEDSYIPSDVSINSICLDARKLIIDKNYVNVISIAGIGGELTIKIIDNLFPQLKKTDILVLSAHNNIHKLREYLIKNDFHILRQGLVKDNDKFYEVLVLKFIKSQKSNIDITFNHRDELSNTSDVLAYYDEQISYLNNKILYNPDSYYEEILKSYSASKSKYI